MTVLPEDILQPPGHGVSQVLQEEDAVPLGGELERLQRDALDMKINQFSAAPALSASGPWQWWWVYHE